MATPAAGSIGDHPLAEAAERGAEAAGLRARALATQCARLREGDGTTVADVADAATYLDEARRRHHEARRRLVTTQLARAHERVLGQDFLVAARRLARLTLAESVRRTPLDPGDPSGLP